VLTASHGPAVATAFGLGDGRLEGPLDRGELGRVWRLDTDAGRYAVKEPLVELAAAELLDLERTARFQDRAGAAVDLVVPPVIRTAAGSAVAWIDEVPVRAYGWVDMAPTDRRMDPAAAGRAVAGLHQVVVPAWGEVDPWVSRPLGDEAWAALVEEVARARAPYTEPLRQLLPEQSRVEGVLGDVAAVQTCHLDLWADNLRRTPDGSICVFDFDGAGPGDPTGEVGMLLVDLGGGQVDRMRALYDAYREAGGPGVVAGPEALTMAVAQLGHITEYACRRWLDTEDLSERTRLEALVHEYVDEPVTLALVDTILAATR
jgi:Ser/Thr protein kinase RdoA (MazF antagonist)